MPYVRNVVLERRANMCAWKAMRGSCCEGFIGVCWSEGSFPLHYRTLRISIQHATSRNVIKHVGFQQDGGRILETCSYICVSS